MLLAAGACGNLGDLSAVIALEVTAPDSLEEYDTLRPRARALDGHGAEVRGDAIVWFTLDTAILTLSNATTGKTIVNHVSPTPGRLLARTNDSVYSNVISVQPLAAADTLFAPGPTALSPRRADSLSGALNVELADTLKSSTGGDSLVPLAGRPIAYAILYPKPDGPVKLVAGDTSHSLVTATTVTTGSSGVAFVQVRLLGPAVPDSVVVTAIAHRARSSADTIRGSPVTFTVKFVP